MKKAFHNYSGAQLSSEKIEDVLSLIPPNPSYNDWIRIISAVCHEIGDEEEAERLLTAWSPDYGNKTTMDVIRSFHGDYRCSAGTLFYFAKLNGYSSWKKGGAWNGRA